MKLSKVENLRDLGKTQLIELVELYRTESRTDRLTQLPNRHAGEAALDAAVSMAERHEQPFAVLLIDIDHFKRVNDDHGHDVGDEALQAVAVALRDAVRPSDTACRWGGEEFLVTCPHTTEAQALVLAQRIRRAVEALELDALPGGLTVSIGASGAPGLTYDKPTLVKQADVALYAAKDGGRNRVARIFAASAA